METILELSIMILTGCQGYGLLLSLLWLKIFFGFITSTKDVTQQPAFVCCQTQKDAVCPFVSAEDRQNKRAPEGNVLKTCSLRGRRAQAVWPFSIWRRQPGEPLSTRNTLSRKRKLLTTFMTLSANVYDDGLIW